MELGLYYRKFGSSGSFIRYADLLYSSDGIPFAVPVVFHSVFEPQPVIDRLLRLGYEIRVKELNNV